MSDSLNNRSRAHLTTELTCGDAALCVLVPQPSGRGSFQLLITMLIPILIASFQSLHMRWTYRAISKKLLDIVLRIFFPEGVLWLVLHEERERRLVMKELKERQHDPGIFDEGDVSEATNQQLMAVQAGKMYLELVGPGRSATDLPSVDERNDGIYGEEMVMNSAQHRHQASGDHLTVQHPQPQRATYIPPYPISRPPSIRADSSVQELRQPSLRVPPAPFSSSQNSYTGGIRTTGTGRNANSIGQHYPRIVWSSEEPKGHRQLELGDLNEFSSLLSSLPNGGGLPLPDLTFMMLVFQDAWLLMTIITRLLSSDQRYQISILEVFAVFSLTIFIMERVVTRNHKPAWTNQYVIIQMEKATYQPPFPISHRHRFASKNPFLLPGVVVPAISVFLWSIGLFVYGTMTSPAYHTQVACQISAIGYLLAILYFLFLKMIDRQGYEPLGNWTRWLPPKWCVYVLAVTSRLVILGFAVVQVFWGEKELFDGPIVWAMIPHIGA